MDWVTTEEIGTSSSICSPLPTATPVPGIGCCSCDGGGVGGLRSGAFKTEGEGDPAGAEGCWTALGFAGAGASGRAAAEAEVRAAAACAAADRSTLVFAAAFR